MLEQPAVVVAVRVDEAGREREAARVDHAVAAGAPDARADALDAAVGDANVGAPARGAGPIDDLGVDDDRRLRGGRGDAHERADRENEQQ